MDNPIKPNFKTEFFPVFIVLLAMAASFYFYQNFPDQVPTHWNFQGEPDQYSSRALGAFLFPGIIAGMYLLFVLLPLADPKKARYEQFRRVYHIVKDLLIIFMAAMYFLASLAGLGYNINIGTWIPLMVGVLFMVIGNYLSKVKPNWFLGIRTPWTLSSEEVWNKTHRAGGKIFILGGLVFLFMPWLPAAWRPSALLAIVLVIVIGTFGYSYWLYRQEEAKKHIQQ